MKKPKLMESFLWCVWQRAPSSESSAEGPWLTCRCLPRRLCHVSPSRASTALRACSWSQRAWPEPGVSWQPGSSGQGVGTERLGRQREEAHTGPEPERREAGRGRQEEVAGSRSLSKQFLPSEWQMDTENTLG